MHELRQLKVDRELLVIVYPSFEEGIWIFLFHCLVFFNISQQRNCVTKTCESLEVRKWKHPQSSVTCLLPYPVAASRLHPAALTFFTSNKLGGHLCPPALERWRTESMCVWRAAPASVHTAVSGSDCRFPLLCVFGTIAVSHIIHFRNNQ